MDREQLFVCCDCMSPEHLARFIYWPGDEYDQLYLTVHLNRGGFFSRVKSALKYVFGRRPSKYGDFDELIVSGKDVTKLREFLESYEASQRERNGLQRKDRT